MCVIVPKKEKIAVVRLLLLFYRSTSSLISLITASITTIADREKDTNANP
jgi:hypothetical protein